MSNRDRQPGQRDAPLIRRRRQAATGFSIIVILVAGASWWLGRTTATTGSVARSQAPPRPALLTTHVVDRRMTVSLRARGEVTTRGVEKVTLGQMQVPNAL